MNDSPSHPKLLSTALALALAAGIAAPTTAAAGEIFGVTPGAGGSTFIPAFDFHKIFANGCGMNYDTFNYYQQSTGCAAAAYMASLDLPEGANIQSYRILHRDNDDTTNLTAQINRYYSPLSSGAAIGSETLAGSSWNSDAAASTDFKMPAQVLTGGHIYDSYDHTTQRHYAYAVRVFMPASDKDISFKGVWIFWNRTIAPAPASASFADVPTNHFFS